MEIAVAGLVGLVLIYIIYRLFRAFVKWLILIAIALLVSGYFTNPSPERHQAALNEKTRSLGIKKIRKKNVVVENYKVVSLTKVKVDDQEKLVGIGAFGNIWFIGNLAKKLEK